MRRGLDYLEEDTWGTVFRDVILLALIGEPGGHRAGRQNSAAGRGAPRQ